MIIPLNPKRRLIGSQSQWTLQMRHKESSKRWRNYQYFTTLQTALHGAAEEEIRMAPTETLILMIDHDKNFSTSSVCLNVSLPSVLAAVVSLVLFFGCR